MISPAVIPALEALGLDIVWGITSENKFITANGAIVDLSGFRGEELAMFKNLDDDRKATLIENIAYRAGFTVDVAGNANDAEGAIDIGTEAQAVEEPILVAHQETEADVATQEEEIEAPVITEDEVVETTAVAEEEVVVAEDVPAKKTSKKKA